MARMSDDYTPTTEQVREAASLNGGIAVEPDAFNRWLAEHDAEVAEKAWYEGAVFGVRDQHGTVDTYIRDAIERRNPYRLSAEWREN